MDFKEETWSLARRVSCCQFQWCLFGACKVPSSSRTISSVLFARFQFFRLKRAIPCSRSIQGFRFGSFAIMIIMMMMGERTKCLMRHDTSTAQSTKKNNFDRNYVYESSSTKGILHSRPDWVEKWSTNRSDNGMFYRRNERKLNSSSDTEML
jgi:hypothetical protein